MPGSVAHAHGRPVSPCRDRNSKPWVVLQRGLRRGHGGRPIAPNLKKAIGLGDELLAAVRPDPDHRQKAPLGINNRQCSE